MENEYTVGSRVDHIRYGEGIVSKVALTSISIIFINANGEMSFSKTSQDIELIEENETGSGAETSGIDVKELELMMTQVLEKYQGLQEIVPMGDKWINGNLVLQPANPDLSNKEVPIATFFHKIVMLRDRLRVLEQNINSHTVLSDEEKVHLQQYITRCYGSLTTFNVLFKNKEDYFKGAGK